MAVSPMGTESFFLHKTFAFRDIYSPEALKLCYNKAMGKNNSNVDYKKLWKLLIDKEMKKTDLITVAGISSNVLAKLNKGEFVSMESLQKICKALGCDMGDIASFEEK